MPVIRELITRFGFEVDEKGAKDVEKRVDGMKKGIGGLGKLLGFTVGAAGAKAFFNIGQRAARAEFNLKRLAGTNFAGLRKQFADIQKDINGIREGAGKIITERQFDIAAAGFLKVFGRGQSQVEAFGKLFNFAAKQAVITGQEVTDIVDQIQSGIAGGGFDAFLDLPGFDIFRKQFLEFQQAAIDPGDPGGRIALQNRLKAIIGIVTGAAKEQNNVLTEIPAELLEVDKATARTKDTFDELAKTINKALVPAMEGLNATFDRFNELANIAKEAKTPGGAFEAVLSEILNPKEKPKPVTPLAGSRTAAEAFPGQNTVDQNGLNLPGSQKTPPPTGERGSDVITIHNTFPLPAGSDPVAIGREVNKALQAQLSNVRKSIIKTED